MVPNHTFCNFASSSRASFVGQPPVMIVCQRASRQARSTLVVFPFCAFTGVIIIICARTPSSGMSLLLRWTPSRKALTRLDTLLLDLKRDSRMILLATNDMTSYLYQRPQQLLQLSPAIHKLDTAEDERQNVIGPITCFPYSV